MMQGLRHYFSGTYITDIFVLTIARTVQKQENRFVM